MKFTWERHLFSPSDSSILSDNSFDNVKKPKYFFFVSGSTENEYVMKCVMRTFSCLKELVIPYLAHLLPVLTQKLQQAAKNPTKPHFNHYLFEALCLSIRIGKLNF